MYQQLSLLENLDAGMAGKNATHSAGKGERFHDWFSYLEGFSSSFVRSVRSKYMPESKMILEPFAGIGTTPIHLSELGVDCAYCEVNPVLQHLVGTKTAVLALRPVERAALSAELTRLSAKLETSCRRYSDRKLRKSFEAAFGTSRFFDPPIFEKTLSLKSLNRRLESQAPLLGAVFSIAVYSSLLEGSLLKRAGDVRYKTPKELARGTPDIYDLVRRKLLLIAHDLLFTEQSQVLPRLVCGDAKQLGRFPSLKADGVITSPPYLNGTNYFRNTRLELWYLEHITASNTLRDYRDAAITSGINDVVLSKQINVLPEVESVYSTLTKCAYDVRIPKMVSDYFSDMQSVLLGLKRHSRPGAMVCIDIGDSIYSGVHVATHEILVRIAERIGFDFVEQQVLRERLSYNKQRLTQRLLVLCK